MLAFTTVSLVSAVFVVLTFSLATSSTTTFASTATSRLGKLVY
jgi:hypothetical protein